MLNTGIFECIYYALKQINIDKDLKNPRHKEIAKEYMGFDTDKLIKGEYDIKLMCDICQLWNEVK